MHDEECPEGGGAAISSGNGRPLVEVIEGLDKFLVVSPEYINAMPWIQRERMSYEAFRTHAEAQGLPPPTREQWFETYGLTPAELDELDALIEARSIERGEGRLKDLDGHFFVRKFGNKPRVCWRQADGRLGQMSVHDFKTAYGDKRVQVGPDKNGKVAWKPLAEVWLNHGDTPRHARVEFLPGKRPWEVPEDTYNLWAGWPEGLERERDKHPRPVGTPPEPDDRHDGPEEPEECKLWLAHLHDNVCGGDHEVYTYLLGWMADGLLRPGPSEVAVVMTGPSGSGKGTVANLYGEFFGPHYFVANRREQIEGKFNRHLMETQLLFGDEVDFGEGEAANKHLRNLVTETTVPIEPKGVDAFTAPKWFRIMLATNSPRAVKVLQDDRRFLVLNVDAGEHNRDRAYFADIRREWESGGRVAFFRWLTGRAWREYLESGGWDVGKRPETAALQEQKVLSLSPADQFLLGALEDGALHLPRPGNSKAPRDTVLSSPLLVAMREHSPRLRDWSDQQLTDALKGWGCTRWKSGNERGWTFPPLGEMRASWEARVGPHDWPDGATDWAEATPDERPPF